MINKKKYLLEEEGEGVGVLAGEGGGHDAQDEDRLGGHRLERVIAVGRRDHQLVGQHRAEGQHIVRCRRSTTAIITDATSAATHSSHSYFMWGRTVCEGLDRVGAAGITKHAQVVGALS